MVTDRVGDFIIRLQNAAMIGKEVVVTPYSGHLFAIAEKLKELGFLTHVEVVGGKDTSSVKKQFAVTLAYDAKGIAKLRGVKRISKPGRRLYTPAMGAHTVKGGTGARLISSPAGILSDREARKQHVGGEDLFEIW